MRGAAQSTFTGDTKQTVKTRQGLVCSYFGSFSQPRHTNPLNYPDRIPDESYSSSLMRAHSRPRFSPSVAVTRAVEEEGGFEPIVVQLRRRKKEGGGGWEVQGSSAVAGVASAQEASGVCAHGYGGSLRAQV